MSDMPEMEQQPAGLDIAIVGMAGRFPGATDLDQFWRNLRDGVESISFFSDEELQAAGVTSAEYSSPNYVRASPVLKDIELFDADFFGYSPLEAKTMDPQQRFLLECVWEALEQAGYDPEKHDEPIGAFMGARMSSYLPGLYNDPVLSQPQNMLLVLLGNDISSLSTRLSYKLNLRGPSCAVQTGCSTSLVAIHLACQSLLFGECRMALAGGVTINVPHTVGYEYEPGSMLSPDGHVRSFDAQAGGTVFGSGMGVVVLKRLEDALEDGDTIYAVVKGSATNNDGSFKASFTAPSVEGQSAVIIDALASSGIDAETISYIEAHATATALGDPIEVRALSNAFRAQTTRKGFCRIGTVKSNMGHLDAAAGMAGLLKTVLALQHREIPPSLNFQSPNPEIDFANSPFVVNTELTPWTTDGQPRRAGISSFGFGGTNAHIILEEAPEVEPSGPSRAYQLVTLSARTGAALDRATANLADHLRRHPEQPFADVAYTLKVGRRDWGRRRIVVCRSAEEAATVLESSDPSRVFSNERESGERPVVFMFPGQGAQYVGMGRELYKTELVFREAVDRCAAILRPSLGLDLRDVLYAADADSAAEQLEQTALTQPALFVIEYALAQLWMSWGIKPQAMIGHSIGEYVAATIAGVFALDDALRLVAMRGKLMQALPSGAMLSVPLPEAEVRAMINSAIDLAASNGPSLSVVSGPFDAIDALQAQLEAQGTSCRRLHTSHAFHSRMMEPILARFAEEVRRVRLSQPSMPFISNVSGAWITAEQATDPQYWAQHLRQPVRFAEGIRTLVAEADRILLEVGPGRTLSTLARQSIAQDAATIALPSLRGPQDDQSDAELLLTTLGKLWIAGLTIDWRGFYEGERRQRVPLPTYPFERQRYWVDAANKSMAPAQTKYALDKDANLDNWFYLPSWKQSMIPEPLQPGELATTIDTWLIFADEHGIGERIAGQLSDQGQSVLTVRAGAQFRAIGQRSYTIDPQRQQDYVALISELRATDRLPGKIIHCWTVTPDDQTRSGSDLYERMQSLGFYSLVYLAQALGSDDLSTTIDIGVVSNQLHDVTGGERLSPEKAPLLGPCRVIPREYLSITCRSLDFVVPQIGDRQADEIAERVLAEMRSAPESLSAIVAYRGARRWTQTIDTMRLPQPAARPSRIRDRGVYLITGGLGGIGLVLGEYLARTAQAKLALVGRSAFPAPETWAEWLAAHGDDDATSRTIRKLQQIEAQGGDVLTLRADVADPDQMRAAVEHTLGRFGALHGVIHAAGVAGGGLLQLKTPEMIERVLSAKTRGVLAIESATRDLPLDFMVLCSSLTAMVGEFGQSDYAAANAFLDAFAHWQAARGGPWTVTINWDNWQEVGMAVHSELPPEMTAIHQQIMQGGILPSEGVQIFERIMAQRSAPQVLVSTKHLPTRIESIHALTRAMLTEAQQQTRDLANRSGHARPELATAYVAPRNEFEQNVAKVWQELLGIDEIGVHDSFFDLGGHSLLITQLVNKLQQVYQVDISLQNLFDNPTVAGMAHVIEQGYLEKAASDDRPIKEQLRDVRGSERLNLLEAYWKRKMARSLRLDIDQIPADGSLEAFDLGSVIVEAQWDFKNDLGLQVYPHETVRLRSIGEMARFTAAELDRRERYRKLSYTSPNSPFQEFEAQSILEQRVAVSPIVNVPSKNPPIVFLQSGPRSGSTIFRVMLAGHPQLFSPPELGILWYDTLREWQRSTNDPDVGHGFYWAGQGMEWSFMELMGLDLEATRAQLSEMIARDTTIAEVYRIFQERAAPRLLVDKSPSYGMNIDALRRAEHIFDGALHLHLVRHPYAMMESFVRIRLDKLFAPVIYGRDDVDPYVVAEKVWLTCNRNYVNFLREVPADRQLRVYYEQLVSQPEPIMREICGFLGLPYDPAVTQPYDNKRERMISGIGDPNILTHTGLDASLGETWRTIRLPWRLSDETRALAAELGYELPAESEAAEPPISADLLELGDATTLESLIARAKELSPEEVQALLTDLEQTS